MGASVLKGGDCMRQTDTLPIPDKCLKQTAYPLNKYDGETLTRVTWPACIYFKNGKCQLNACIKNTRGSVAELSDEERYYKKGQEEGIRAFIKELLSSE